MAKGDSIMNETNALLNNITFQFSISKQLLEYHLTSLGQDEYRWCSPNAGLYIQEKNGRWVADLPETEAYHIGTPSPPGYYGISLTGGKWYWIILSGKAS